MGVLLNWGMDHYTCILKAQCFPKQTAIHEARAYLAAACTLLVTHGIRMLHLTSQNTKLNNLYNDHCK